jgi:hypothetical protein
MTKNRTFRYFTSTFESNIGKINLPVFFWNIHILLRNKTFRNKLKNKTFENFYARGQLDLPIGWTWYEKD